MSKATGQASSIIIDRNMMGKVTGITSNARALVTPDEVQRGSEENIIAFMGKKPPTVYLKFPYYQCPNWVDKANKIIIYNVLLFDK